MLLQSATQPPSVLKIINCIIQASGDDGEEYHEKLDKMEYKESDVLGEALCSLVAHDAPAM